MNKKMRELLNKIAQKRMMARDFMDGENKDLEKAAALMDEADELQKEYDLEARMYAAEKEDNTPTDEEVAEEKANKQEKNVIKEVADAIRRVAKTLNEGTGTEGGYTVPADIVTKIQELREAQFSLEELVTVESVSTMAGERTYKTRAQKTGFTKVGEKSAIPAVAGPAFSRLQYAISKYAGYLPITNELLEDSDENLVNTVLAWLADESRVTRNNLILAAIRTKAAKAIDSGIKGIKSVLNKDLGQAFKPTSVVVTNDDGLDYLDQLEDKNGRPLLNPDPTNSANMQLRAGATVVPIKVIPNTDMATTESKVPFLIGDFKEGIVLFDRKKINIMTSNTAVVGSGEDEINAFEDDCTIFRGIEREDVRVRDNKAFENCYIDVSSTAEEEEEGEGEQA
ncbi:MAG: phage major capsid protein [Clostridia bacterium]|nr:phage major capsid protein [Clostridia bacterium]